MLEGPGALLLRAARYFAAAGDVRSAAALAYMAAALKGVVPGYAEASVAKQRLVEALAEAGLPVLMYKRVYGGVVAVVAARDPESGTVWGYVVELPVVYDPGSLSGLVVYRSMLVPPAPLTLDGKTERAVAELFLDPTGWHPGPRLREHLESKPWLREALERGVRRLAARLRELLEEGRGLGDPLVRAIVNTLRVLYKVAREARLPPGLVPYMDAAPSSMTRVTGRLARSDVEEFVERVVGRERRGRLGGLVEV